MLACLLRPVERGDLSRINAGGDVAKRRDGTGIDTQGLQRLAENTVWEIEVVHLGASLGRIILWEKAHRASVWAATGFCDERITATLGRAEAAVTTRLPCPAPLSADPRSGETGPPAPRRGAWLAT